MRIWMVMMVVMVSVGMAGASVAEDTKPFSLEYCPQTPTPPAANGKTTSALTAKYFPGLTEGFKLYMGTGLAYSLPAQSEENRKTESGVKTGVAGQAGIDFKVSGTTSINLDYKYLHLMQDPDVSRSPHLVGMRLLCNF